MMLNQIERAYAERLRAHEEQFGKLTSKEEVIACLFYAHGAADIVAKAKETV